MIARSLTTRQQQPVPHIPQKSAICPPTQCLDSERCRAKAASIQRRMRAMIQVVQSDYEHLVREHLFAITKHADVRMDERDIPLRVVYEILECYEPIEWTEVPPSRVRVDAMGKRLFHADPYRILITGESELIERHVCVACGYARPVFGQPWTLRVLSVFYPQDYPHQWDANFTQRQCFCENKEHTSRLRGVQAKIEQYYQSVDGSDSVVYSTPW